MVIAIPIHQNQLSQHFGHCKIFRFYHVSEDREFSSIRNLTPPPHEPGVLPKWLADEGANIIITGGMGMHAQNLFHQYGIEVVLGAESGDPDCIVKEWLKGTLATGDNRCDH